MTATAPKFVGTTSVTGTGINGTSWSFKDNAIGAADGSPTTCPLLGASDTSQGLYVSNFGFDGVSGVPTGATINGIVATVTRMSVPQSVRYAYDLTLKLATAANTFVSEEKAYSGVWPENSYATRSYGGVSDTWAWGAISAASIRASSFGLIFGAKCDDDFTLQIGSVDANVDSFSMTVHYTDGGGVASVVTKRPAMSGLSGLSAIN